VEQRRVGRDHIERGGDLPRALDPAPIDAQRRDGSPCKAAQAQQRTGEGQQQPRGPVLDPLWASINAAAMLGCEAGIA